MAQSPTRTAARKVDGKTTERIEEALCVLPGNQYLPFDKLMKHWFPDLIDNLEFWRAFLDVYELLRDGKPSEVLGNKELVLFDSDVYELLCDRKPSKVLGNKELVLQLCFYDLRSFDLFRFADRRPTRH